MTYEELVDSFRTKSQQVGELCGQGKYAEALPVAEAASEEVRRAVGDDDLLFAIGQNNIAGLYQKLGRYAEAIPPYLKALAIRVAALGEDDPSVADVRHNLATLYVAMGRYAEAERETNLALKVREAPASPRGPLGVAATLNCLATIAYRRGDLAGAARAYERALALRRAALGDNAVEVGIILNNLADLNAETASPLAEARYNEALAIGRAAGDAGHALIATSLNGLADLAKAAGEYARAARLFDEALAEARAGSHLPEFVTTLTNQATLFSEMGQYDRAEPLFLRALEIHRGTVGEWHPEYATALNNLGGLYESRGDYRRAEAYYRQALEVREAALGDRSPDVANSLNSLGALAHALGDFAKAEPLYRRALEIRQNVFEPGHPAIATSLHNLAALARSRGDHATALALARQACGQISAASGDASPAHATALSNLASLLADGHRYDEAEAIHRRVLEIRQGLPEESPINLALARNNLADVLRARGDLGAAESLYREALETARQALGDRHPGVAVALTNLATIAVPTGRETEALADFQQAATILDGIIGQVFSLGSESRRAAYLADIRLNFDAFLSLVFQLRDRSPEAVAAGLDLVLRRKAIGMEALAVQRDAVLGRRHPELSAALQNWSDLRRRIARKTLDGPGPEGAETHRKLLAEWEERRDEIEASLARTIPEMNLEERLRDADRSRVAAALPAGSALVEIVRLRLFDFQAVPAKGQPKWRAPRYLAFVLQAGVPDGAILVDLGEAVPIDETIAKFQAAMNDKGRDLHSARQQPAVAAGESLAAELRARFFDNLEQALQGTRRLIIAPDGDLARVPFEVLPAGKDRRLIDDYEISYVSVGRDLLRPGADVAMGARSDPVVVAAPDFALGGAGPPLEFSPLEGTSREGEKVARMLHVEPWLGSSAVESRLKAVKAPRILHLATHGFFLEDRLPGSEPDRAGTEPMEGAIGRPALASHKNPLLRSGLALAGAETWVKGGQPPAEAEDGLLTAEDVTGMDLYGTELVVLSACQTGLGDVLVGEGVFGLRRAFVLAGSATLVMSLWKVPDDETCALMVDFHTRLLAGKGPAEALRLAQQELRSRCPEIARWGAFICQGDTTPLTSV
jgi:CHAT domain-containing protein/Tfp pilus assembly protein PilF